MQIEAAHQYGINPKRLSELIHGHKYLGDKKRKNSGTKMMKKSRKAKKKNFR